MVAVVGTAGLAFGASLKRGEAWEAGKDPNVLSDVSDGSAGMAGGVPVSVVLDLEKI